MNNRYDFIYLFDCINANPNGDPDAGNLPRIDAETGHGLVTDVCLKRKIRNRLMTMDPKESILVQSNDNTNDEHQSIKARIDASKDFDLKDPKKFKKQACEKWFDVRAFGQIFPFKGTKSGEGVSIPVRGPVTMHSAYSLKPVSITSIQITKSTNLEDTKAGKKGSDTMGMKHRVDFGIYTFFGSINSQLASDETGTGFSDKDAEKLKQALCSMFENDASSARPDGSMEVLKVIWWKHTCQSGNISSAKVHGTLADNIDPKNGEIQDESKLTIPFTEDERSGQLKPEILAGF
jgi:CRISPR-associated protein Csd2